MTDFEDFMTSLFQLNGSPVRLKQKLSFFDLFQQSTIGKLITSKMFSLTDFANSWSATLNKIFSLSEFNTSWSTALNKIFSLTDFNSYWSSKLNNIFSLADFSTAWSTTLNKIFNLSDFGIWIDNNLKDKINSAVISTLGTKITVNSILDASINKIGKFLPLKFQLGDDLGLDFGRVIYPWESDTFQLGWMFYDFIRRCQQALYDITVDSVQWLR